MGHRRRRPSRFDIFTAEALDAHKVYVVEVRHPVEVSGAERPHLVQWLSKRLDYELRMPDLERSGLKLVGGRLLPGPFGPAAFFMYEGPSGERFTIYYARTDSPQTAMRYRAGERFAALYWVDHGLAYVVSGPPERERLATWPRRPTTRSTRPRTTGAPERIAATSVGALRQRRIAVGCGSPHVLPGIIGLRCLPRPHQFVEVGIAAVRQYDTHAGEQVALAVSSPGSPCP